MSTERVPRQRRRVRWKLEAVRCEYPGRGEVLKGVTLQVRAGETLGLVGRTGYGKSTLLNLIPRLLDVTSGVVRVDGLCVRQYRLPDLRSRIGFVTQDAFLFSRTLAENVAFGGDRDVSAVIQAAGLNPDLEALPQGIDTLIGERGVTLSGGQKQRTTLARALARDPAILLLDDAFSSVDSHTEEAILRGLTALRRGRTTVIVSHRLSALRQADRIAVLDGGKVVAVAPHDELLNLPAVRGAMGATAFDRTGLG